MGTHALINLKDDESTIKLYRHFDGYPEETGQDLKQYIQFGDVKSLADILTDKTDYEIINDNKNCYVHYTYDVDLCNKSIKGWSNQNKQVFSYPQ